MRQLQSKFSSCHSTSFSYMSYLVQGTDCVSFRNSDAIQDRKGRKSYTPIKLCHDCQNAATNDLAACVDLCRFKGEYSVH